MSLRKHMMVAGLLIGIVLIAVPAQATEFQCKMQLSKAPCWQNYDVKFDFVNTMSRQIFQSETLPKGTLTKTVALNCTNLTSMTIQTSYTPVVWENMSGATYKSNILWVIPTVLPANTVGWTGQTCFASDYQAVPMPLGDISQCSACVSSPGSVSPVGATGQ